MTRVLVPLMEGFEEIEAITLIDILRRGGIEVVTAGLSPNPIVGAHGIAILAEKSLAAIQASDFDAIVLPGGIGTAALRADVHVKRLVQEFYSQGKVTAAICAAPTVLSDLGMLVGRRATSHPSKKSEISAAVYLEDPVVEDGPIITSRGAGTAMAFALALLERLQGKQQAEAVAQAVTYKPSL